MKNPTLVDPVSVGKDKGVSPWRTAGFRAQAPEGRQRRLCRRLRGFPGTRAGSQGLTPLAIDRRRSAAKNPSKNYPVFSGLARGWMV